MPSWTFHQRKATEAEWLTDSDHLALFSALKEDTSPRKLMLFTCLGLRRVRYYDATVIDLIEGYAERRTKRIEAQSAVKAARFKGQIDAYCANLFWRDKCYYGAYMVTERAANNALSSHGQEDEKNRRIEEKYQADLVREIFGNPFRSVGFDPTWRTSDVLLLARGIYEERAFDRMPILADALQDAGCDNADILAHLRDPKATHVRGCWALDLVLGKE